MFSDRSDLALSTACSARCTRSLNSSTRVLSQVVAARVASSFASNWSTIYWLAIAFTILAEVLGLPETYEISITRLRPTGFRVRPFRTLSITDRRVLRAASIGSGAGASGATKPIFMAKSRTSGGIDTNSLARSIKLSSGSRSDGLNSGLSSRFNSLMTRSIRLVERNTSTWSSSLLASNCWSTRTSCILTTLLC